MSSNHLSTFSTDPSTISKSSTWDKSKSLRDHAVKISKVLRCFDSDLSVRLESCADFFQHSFLSMRIFAQEVGRRREKCSCRMAACHDQDDRILLQCCCGELATFEIREDIVAIVAIFPLQSSFYERFDVVVNVNLRLQRRLWNERFQYRIETVPLKLIDLACSDDSRHDNPHKKVRLRVFEAVERSPEGEITQHVECDEIVPVMQVLDARTVICGIGNG